jgi:hypothetical protein
MEEKVLLEIKELLDSSEVLLLLTLITILAIFIGELRQRLLDKGDNNKGNNKNLSNERIKLHFQFIVIFEFPLILSALLLTYKFLALKVYGDLIPVWIDRLAQGLFGFAVVFLIIYELIQWNITRKAVCSNCSNIHAVIASDKNKPELSEQKINPLSEAQNQS